MFVILLVVLNVIVVLKMVSAELSGSSAPVAPTRVVVKPPPVTPVIFADAEQRIQMTATSAWSEEPISIPGGILFFHDPTRDLGVMVFAEEREPLDRAYNNLDAYGTLLRGVLQQDLEGGTQSTPQRITVGGYPAVQSRIAGTKNGLSVTFLHTVIETPERYFQIRVICQSVHFPEYESSLLEVMASTRFAPLDDLPQ